MFHRTTETASAPIGLASPRFVTGKTMFDTRKGAKRHLVWDTIERATVGYYLTDEKARLAATKMNRKAETA